MESPLSLLRMHWDLEPIGFPLTRPTDTLSPIGGEGQGEGVRFMESPLSLFRMHWDPEPTPAPPWRGGYQLASSLLGGVRGGLVCARFTESPRRDAAALR